MRNVYSNIAEGSVWDSDLEARGWNCTQDPGEHRAPDVAVVDSTTQRLPQGRPPTIYVSNPGDPCRNLEAAHTVLYRPAEPAVAALLAEELSEIRGTRAPAARISALQARYIEGLTERVAAIDADLRWSRSESDQGALGSALKAAHRIHGTAGMYGLPELGEAAGRLEAALKAIGTDGDGWEEAAGRVQELRAKARSVSAHTDVSHPYVLAAGATRDTDLEDLDTFASERAFALSRERTLAEALRRARRSPPELIHIGAPDALAWARALRMVPGCSGVPIVLTTTGTPEAHLWTGATHADEGALHARLSELSPTGRRVAILAQPDVEEQVRAALAATGIRLVTMRPGVTADLYLIGPCVEEVPNVGRARTLRLLKDFSPASRRAALSDAADYAAIPVIAEELVHRLADLAARIAPIDDTRGSSSGLATTQHLAQRIAALRPGGGCVAVAAIRARELGALDDRMGAGARADVLALAGHVLRGRFPTQSVRGQLDDGGLAVALVAPDSGVALGAIRAVVRELTSMAFVLDNGVARLTFRAGVACSHMPQPEADTLLQRASETQIQAACAPQRGALALATSLEAVG